MEEAGSRPNTFPGNKNPADGFSESSTGDSNNANGLKKNQVRITVEVPTSLAPGAPLSRRNLRLVQPDGISVYRTNQTLTRISSVDTEHGVDDDGFDVIEFSEGQPLGPDVLIEVDYNGTRIRAFATDRDRDIKVNPFSEYLVRNALGGYSSAQFEEVMECVNSSDDALCINKYVWSTLADQIQDFEIDIPDGNDIDSAVALLDDRADFAGYVSDMADLAQVPPNESGVISAQSVNMNTVFFGLELGRTSRFSDEPASQWGTRRGYEEQLESSGTAYVYPGLSMASLEALGISVTTLASDVPYERATLTRFADYTPQTEGPDFWGINSHATSGSPASIVNDTRLLSGQALFQTITGKNSAQPIGWSRNPYFLDAQLQLTGQDPNALLASYFVGGRAIELEGSSGDYERGALVEEHYTSVFDVSLTKTDVKEEGAFQIVTLADNYNVVSFSVQLGDSSFPYRAESFVGTWTESGGIAGQYTQQADAREINRTPNGAIGTATPNRADTAQIGNRTSTTSSGPEENGRLNLDYTGIGNGSRSEDGIGASNPDGSIVAFNLNNPANGDGILIAMERSTHSPELANYRLQGTIAGLGPDTNYLRHIKDGQLSFTSGTEASVSLAGFQVEQQISTRGLTRPVKSSSDPVDLTYTQDGTTGRLSFTAGSGAMEMDGFVSSNGEYLTLRIREASGSGEQYLGLLLGTLED
ncbi:hypothetical protein RE428_17780 [Marinobacter nanhaiticus D15-8W]|uniref:Uncharacterized protein n=1 Tax=Marinobacter nanhaiticus D15-8W TaxID=626887 RepID=N6WX37_9GAMM|nr:hypothetical protein [Marinobacter nanhaiticus]ENO13393.1 hypothetical protein J057_18395 [Marinobacter nanhaiticus D15-8W]BES70760.1 hypothetical protein RE428_17780 [Marinobacter nanhaiticus D15-8W]